MPQHTFDALTRQITAAVTRRTSLLTLSAMAMTASMARPPAAEAATCNDRIKRARAKCRKIQERKCLRLRTQCVDVTNAFCNGDLGCIAATYPCCNMFDDTCSATAALECLLSGNQETIVRQ